jgi:guanylate kinase
VSENTIREMDAKGELLTINKIYGIYYATPKKDIDEALSKGLFPILDWPADKMSIMQEKYADKLFVAYLEPDNVQELQRRLLLDQRDLDGKRFQAGKEELDHFFKGDYDPFIHLKLRNTRGQQEKIAQTIYEKLK